VFFGIMKSSSSVSRKEDDFLIMKSKKIPVINIIYAEITNCLAVEVHESNKVTWNQWAEEGFHHHPINVNAQCSLFSWRDIIFIKL